MAYPGELFEGMEVLNLQGQEAALRFYATSHDRRVREIGEQVESGVFKAPEHPPGSNGRSGNYAIVEAATHALFDQLNSAGRDALVRFVKDEERRQRTDFMASEAFSAIYGGMHFVSWLTIAEYGPADCNPPARSWLDSFSFYHRLCSSGREVAWAGERSWVNRGLGASSRHPWFVTHLARRTVGMDWREESKALQSDPALLEAAYAVVHGDHDSHSLPTHLPRSPYLVIKERGNVTMYNIDPRNGNTDPLRMVKAHPLEINANGQDGWRATKTLPDPMVVSYVAPAPSEVWYFDRDGSSEWILDEWDLLHADKTGCTVFPADDEEPAPEPPDGSDLHLPHPLSPIYKHAKYIYNNAGMLPPSRMRNRAREIMRLIEEE